jgi:hypothetical protein
MNLRYILIAIAVGPLASCAARADSSVLPRPCPAPNVATANWSTIRESGFSFKLPAGYERIPVQGIDSNVGRFRNAAKDAEVSFDWGWYSNNLANDPTTFSSYSACAETIGGRAATVVTGVLRGGDRAGHYVAAATWRDIYNGENPVHLTIWNTTRDPAHLAELLGMLRTVEFAARGSSGAEP